MKRKDKYQGYSLDATEAEVLAAFENKFGRPPAEVIRTGGSVLAGPINGLNGLNGVNGSGDLRCSRLVRAG